MQQFEHYKDHVFLDNTQTPQQNAPRRGRDRDDDDRREPDFNTNMTPMGPPPQVVPTRNTATRFVDSGSIRMCLRNFTYVWLSNGEAFWMYPIQVGRNSVSGFRWNGRFGWVYFGIDLKRIDSFYCIPF